jgi:hypothetical protein
MRGAALRGKARDYYDLASAVERVQIDDRLRQLELDPSADGVIRFDIPGVPGFLLLDDGLWRMTYVVRDDATIVIRSIAHALDLPE